MSKYFLSYLGGGCLGAIALSSFLTEISRLVPVVWQGFVVVWLLGALFSGGVIRWKELETEAGGAWLLVNLFILLGVCIGVT